MDIIEEYRYDILKRLLKILDVDIYQLPITVKAEIFKNIHVVNQCKNLIPVIRKFYSSDKNTALHSNAFDKQKNPVLNLVRQILKEHSYDIKSHLRYDAKTQKKIKVYVIRREYFEDDNQDIPEPRPKTYKIAPIIVKKNPN